MTSPASFLPQLPSNPPSNAVPRSRRANKHDAAKRRRNGAATAAAAATTVGGHHHHQSRQQSLVGIDSVQSSADAAVSGHNFATAHQEHMSDGEATSDDGDCQHGASSAPANDEPLSAGHMQAATADSQAHHSRMSPATSNSQSVTIPHTQTPSPDPATASPSTTAKQGNASPASPDPDTLLARPSRRTPPQVSPAAQDQTDHQASLALPPKHPLHQPASTSSDGHSQGDSSSHDAGHTQVATASGHGKLVSNLKLSRKVAFPSIGATAALVHAFAIADDVEQCFRCAFNTLNIRPSMPYDWPVLCASCKALVTDHLHDTVAKSWHALAGLTWCHLHALCGCYTPTNSFTVA